MSVKVFKSAIVKLGSSASPTTAYAKHVRRVTMNYAAEMLDKTAMGSSGRRRVAGLKDGSFAIEFNQDYSTGLDALLFSLLGSESSNCFVSVRASSAAIGATNPAYQGRCLLESYNPLTGAVGELGTVSASFQADGTIKRVTA